jgi:protein HIRA/HIR1
MQSDDKTVKIWRVSDWGLEASIKNPFIHSPGTAFFKRLRQDTFDMIINIQANVFNSWSPDGGHVAAADGINTHKHVAAIVARDDWNTDVSLVGHKHPVEVTVSIRKVNKTLVFIFILVI